MVVIFDGVFVLDFGAVDIVVCYVFGKSRF
jgi:hypothetical protein